MTTVDVLVALAGLVVTVAVIAGMILLTPRGEVAVHAEGEPSHESNLSPTPATEPASAPARR